ncbi:hypothetical protein QBC42DRAFT_286816 [Cladorrhinum samala]|uniref:Uncharacterized protein n=1 Tax=Cladorrhinum samala TaxID=585594 RepID=A0AAV9HPY6_9PEZI|nr:hypothetical protein QBC42DRAFT_286816 [Cladorrhinum samala]
MKSPFWTVAAFIGLVKSQTSPVPQPLTPSSVVVVGGGGGGTASGTVFSSTTAPTGGVDANAPMCGRGFTYCGYILRDHQKFKEEDIVKAYCAASKDNCANGKTKTDPIQALYVCVPPSAALVQEEEEEEEEGKKNKKNEIQPIDYDYDHDYQDESNHPAAALFQAVNNVQRRGRSRSSSSPSLRFGDGGLFNRKQQQQQDQQQQKSAAKRQQPKVSTVVVVPNTAAVSPPQSSGLSATDSGIGGGDSCSNTATPGNRIELICSCGGQCLNPEADHIGRCDAPCS